ncbi:MAG: 3-hydroxy-3-methylglutaryl-CoA reductase, partial [Candidatus Heimdallarchaeota archaeon]|nr:3-hydroxy-3-methylglutaryl-CoA reductase [Candidatus Heimdallarchaeota archaeon]
MDSKSRIPGFYDKTMEERQGIIKDLLNLSEDDIKTLEGKEISKKTLNIMIENVIGQIPLPVGIATNFTVNKKDYLVPMVT